MTPTFPSLLGPERERGRGRARGTGIISASDVADAVGPRDESRHRASASRWWAETWSFEWTAADGRAADPAPCGFVEVTVLPRAQRTWFVAALLGPDLPYVLCRDDDMAPPAQPAVLELRGSGLWTHAICETPLEHWTVAMEAFAVAMDDPFEAWHGERGDRIGLAFDLEWENDPVAAAWTRPGARYDVPCQVNGELQLGEQRWTIATTGSRSHSWGEVAATTIDAETISSVNGPVAPYVLPGPNGLRRIVRHGGPGPYPTGVLG